MNNFINTVDVIGDAALMDSMIDGTIAEYKDDSVTILMYSVFYDCKNLAVVDVPAVSVIEQNAFSGCSALSALILRNESKVCSLVGQNALSSTPIKNGTGYVYVPKALLSDTDSDKNYRRATNWSTIAAQFRSLEDWTVDGTIWGDLDLDKINAA